MTGRRTRLDEWLETQDERDEPGWLAMLTTTVIIFAAGFLTAHVIWALVR